MVQVYNEPLCRRHYASPLSGAVIVRIGLCCTAIAVSLVVAFATGGFWIKIKPTLAQASVHYTHDALLIFEGSSPGQEQLWSTSPAVNAEFQDNLAAVSVQVGHEDYNFDGKPDAINFIATVSSEAQVHGVKALLQFTYAFSGNVRLQLYGLAYMSHSSHQPGGSLYVDADLVLRQRSPITDRKFNGLYNTSVLNSTSPGFATAVQAGSSLDLQPMLKLYYDRNYTTSLSNVQSVWKSSSGSEFTLHMHIRIPPNQVVWYRPQVIEMLKFGWIQFLATYIVAWWLLWWAEWCVFRYRVITTRVVSDVQPKTQRF